jgi:hypothetical protein
MAMQDKSRPETNRDRMLMRGRNAQASRMGHKPHDGNHNMSGQRTGMSAPKGRAKGMASGKSMRSGRGMTSGKPKTASGRSMH